MVTGARGRVSAVVLALLVGAGLPGARPAAAGLAEFDSTFGAAGTVTLPLPAASADVANRVRDGLIVGAAGPNLALVPEDGTWATISNTPSWEGPVVAEFGVPSVGYDVLFPFPHTPDQVRVVAVGAAGNDFALAAFRPDGTPLRTFGQDGKVTTAFGGKAEAHTAIDVGVKMLVFGTADVDGSSRMALARYSNYDGTLDPTYAQGGTATVELSAGRDVANVAAVSQLGIVVAGQAGNAAFVARFNFDGGFDASFASGGLLLLDLSPGEDTINGLTVDGDNIYVAGQAGNDAVLARIVNGQLDPTFGTGGTVRTTFGGTKATLADVSTFTLEGKAIVAGTVTRAGGATGAVLYRVNANGTPDAGFGSGGLVAADLGPGSYRAGGVSVLRQFGNPPPPSSYRLIATDGADIVTSLRTPTGDPPYNPVRIELTHVNEWASAIERQPDGKIVLAGLSGPLPFLARLLPSGAVDPAFRPGRRTVRDFGPLEPIDVKLAPDGGIVVLARHRFTLSAIRFTPGGEVDVGFGDRGIATVSTTASDISVGARLIPNLDGSFLATPAVTLISPTGVVTRRAPTATDPQGLAAMDTAGGIVYVQPGVTWDVGMRPGRWLATGQVDGNYATGGWPTGTAEAVAALPDGRTLVAGVTGIGLPQYQTDQLLVAFRPDGQVDTSFGDQGAARLDVSSFDQVSDLAVQPDGRIYVAGDISRAGETIRLTLSRYLPNGRLDRTFANNGVLVSTRLANGARTRLQPDGRLLVAGGGPQTGAATVLRLAPAVAAAARPIRTAGWNGLGQLGGLSGSGSGSGSMNATAVAAGANHSLAVRSDGTVAAWGWNLTSQLGDGTASDRAAPVSVVGLANVTAVAAGYLHSLAVKADGTVWAWGWNGYGQLGDGTTALRPTPTQVPGLTNVVAVAAGAYHSLALQADGTVWGWGWNGYGQVGDSTTVDRHSPVRLSRTGIKAIAAGTYHSLALAGDGGVWAWGFNAGAQVGHPYEASFPEQVQGLPPSVTAVAAGTLHNLAVLADGTVYAWGWNAQGQLGDGTFFERVLPVKVTGLAGVSAVAAGSYHSVALLWDGTVRTWGWNSQGQLGDGSTADRFAPVQPAGLAAFDGRSVAAGILHTLVA